MEKYSKIFEVSSYECDVNNQLRLRVLLNYFQDMADNHADKMGVGYHYCIQNGLGWIGGGYDIEINRLPKWGDKVLLKTWPSKTNIATAYREFEMSDVETGEILVRASSQWVLLDTLKNRPLAITKRIEWFDLIEDRAVDTNFPKLPTVDVPQISISQIIRSDDIDLNNHVNNAVYPTWILDALPSEFLSKHTLTKIQIQYKYPAKHGDDIQVLTNVSDENTTQHMIVGTEGKEYARIVCQWQ